VAEVTTIEKSVDVHTPVRTVYNQWTQFESFPKFMSGVDKIEQTTPTRTHWRTTIGGVSREFDAEITEQHPDERVAWRSVSGPEHSGVVTFHRLDDQTTRIHLQMEYTPETLTEKAGTALGVVGHRIQDDLSRFKDFIEHRDNETGEWRGEVDRSPQQGEHQRANRGGHPTQSLPPLGDQTPTPDFAEEHTKPTYADEPAPEPPDESVPQNPAGMDKNRKNPF
jgi:ribosome-associated toxin RatA of RatAB toxin-antitoxin module